MKIKKGTTVSFRTLPQARSTVLFVNGKSEKETIYKKKESEYDTLRQQTEMFWLLQLQFLAMSRYDLGHIAMFYMTTPNYRSNTKTERAKNLADSARSWPCEYTQEDHNCLATHLALQLAGVEE